MVSASPPLVIDSYARPMTTKLSVTEVSFYTSLLPIMVANEKKNRKTDKTET